jgi:hypothetical protein
MRGTLDGVKEKFGNPCKRNLENTQPIFVSLIERTQYSLVILVSQAYNLSSL